MLWKQENRKVMYLYRETIKEISPGSVKRQAQTWARLRSCPRLGRWLHSPYLFEFFFFSSATEASMNCSLFAVFAVASALSCASRYALQVEWHTGERCGQSGLQDSIRLYEINDVNLTPASPVCPLPRTGRKRQEAHFRQEYPADGSARICTRKFHL